jgi:hypothetical protein
MVPQISLRRYRELNGAAPAKGAAIGQCRPPIIAHCVHLRLH